MQSTTGSKVVSYFHDDESGIYMYNPAHPWRPHRSTLVHSLVSGYELDNKMVIHRPRPRSFEELTMFHADGEGLHARTSGFLHQGLGYDFWFGRPLV